MIPIQYNIRSLFVRKANTLAAAFGIGLVVWVLASALMLNAGIKRAMGQSGHDDIAVVLRKGSDVEMSSVVDEPAVGLLKSAPGIKKYADGSPLTVSEIIVVIALEKIGDPGVANVQVRGVQDHVMTFRPEVKIVEGRSARPGTDEVIIGSRIRGRFAGIDLGQSFELRKNKKATVVGIFEANGSSYESEVWGDLNVVRNAFGREGMVSSIRVRLESPSSFDGFATYAEQDKRLGLIALREPVFFENQSEGTSIFVTMLGSIIALFISVGAMIGAMITMYSSISDRQREIGTLRALGFSRRSILLSFLIEAILLAFVGGILGSIAALFMGFVRVPMMNFASWSEMIFTFTPTAQIIVTAFIAATVMGVLGGFFPAMRASKTSPIAAMRG